MDLITKSYLKCRSSLIRLIRRSVANPTDVEDILQETYLRAYAANQRTEVRSIPAYLHTTARNLALNFVTQSSIKRTDCKADMDQHGSELCAGVGLEQRCIELERFAHFCRAVRSLPTQRRRVFVLKKVYGYSLKEIARELDISQKAVEKHVSAGLLSVRDYMQRTGTLAPTKRSRKNAAAGRGHE